MHATPYSWDPAAIYKPISFLFVMMELLRALTRLHSELSEDDESRRFLFPEMHGFVTPLDLIGEHMAIYRDLLSENAATRLQPLGHETFDKSADVGQDSWLYSRLAPLFLSAEIERRLGKEGVWLDYKAYCMNFNSCSRDVFSSYDDVRHDTEHIHQCVDMWMVMAMQDWQTRKRSVFRRSLVLSFESKFMMHGSETWSGHSILIAIEYDDIRKQMRLMVFDYRTFEYTYSVHDRLCKWMADGVGDRCPTVNVVVCLKKRFHEYTEFMTCMSMAYRACVFLSFLRDLELIAETDADFANSSAFMQDRTFRMVNWLCSNADLLSKKYVLIVSKAMSEHIFQMDSASCFLYLVPPKLLCSDLLGDKHVVIASEAATLGAFPYGPLPLSVCDEMDTPLYQRLENDSSVVKINYNAGRDSPIFLIHK